VAEQVFAVPGELAGQTGATFSGQLSKFDGVPAAWEALADRQDLLR
jgi:hypothetical protein